MRLKSKDLAELIDRIIGTYSREFEYMHFSIEGLSKISDRDKGLCKPEDCGCVKLNNGIVFETLSTYGHGCGNRAQEIVVVNGTFEGDNFHFDSAIRMYAKRLNNIYSSEIIAVEPQIDTETEAGKTKLKELLMRSFETLGYREQEFHKVIKQEISAVELFQKFMLRTGRWETPERHFPEYIPKKLRSTQVFANADNPNSIKIAKENGAEGIGLVRIENMNGTSVNDFLELFKCAGKMPISIRLLLEDDNGNKKANLLDYKPLLDNICQAAYETSPRLTIIFPAEILLYPKSMLSRIYGTDIPPSISEDLLRYRKANYQFKIGAIIESPSKETYKDLWIPILEALSFGTNDISAKLYGYVRDGKEISSQKEASILTPEVGNIIEYHMRKVKELDHEGRISYNMRIGVCGYHASVPENVAILQELGIDYLSCIPEEKQIIRNRLSQTKKRNEQHSSFDDGR